MNISFSLLPELLIPVFRKFERILLQFLFSISKYIHLILPNYSKRSKNKKKSKIKKHNKIERERESEREREKEREIERERERGIDKTNKNDSKRFKQTKKIIKNPKKRETETEKKRESSKTNKQKQKTNTYININFRFIFPSTLFIQKFLNYRNKISV